MIVNNKISEKFVENSIIEWLKKDDWIILPVTYNRHGIDIHASKNNREYQIECKGETSAPNVDFLTCVGQIISRMVQINDNIFYAIGLPDIPKYRDLAKRLIPKTIKDKLKLIIIFVDKEGHIEKITPVQP